MTSAASRAISASRCSRALSGASGSGCSGVGRDCACATVSSPLRLLTTRACGGGTGAADCCCCGTGLNPDRACGTMPAWLSRGRCARSCSPPPSWLAAARKSACFGVSAVRVWLKITSSVGTSGASPFTAKPTPRISRAWTSTDSAMVAPSRCASRGGGGRTAGADGISAGRPRARRTGCRQCSGRTARRARARRSGWSR